MEEGFIVTRIHPDDARGAQEVFRLTWLATYPNEEDPDPRYRVTVEDILDYYKGKTTLAYLLELRQKLINFLPGTVYLVAKKYGRVIGVARGETRTAHNELHALYVLPSEQGQGVGQVLLFELILSLNPRLPTRAEVAAYNTKAIEFYKAMGFVETRKRWEDDRFKFKSGARFPLIEMELAARPTSA